MDDKTHDLLDGALDALVRDVRAGTPAPGADLTARVLTDAAALAPLRAPAPAARERTRPRAPGPLAALFLGWTGGAVAAIGLCLALGIGVGMSLTPSEMPMFGAELADLAMLGGDTMGGEDIL